jgi:hypothetical protein
VDACCISGFGNGGYHFNPFVVHYTTNLVDEAIKGASPHGKPPPPRGLAPLPANAITWSKNYILKKN